MQEIFYRLGTDLISIECAKVVHGEPGTNVDRLKIGGEEYSIDPNGTETGFLGYSVLNPIGRG